MSALEVHSYILSKVNGPTTPLLALRNALKENDEVTLDILLRDPYLDLTEASDLLYITAKTGNAAATSKLIEKGVNIEVENENGERPLHTAATFNSQEVVQVLLAAGAALNPETHYGDTPLDLAEEEEHTALARFLEQQGGIYGSAYSISGSIEIEE